MNNINNGLYIISTPIGNLDDITDRAKNILQKADLVICENPKHSLKLLNNLGIKKKLISLHDYNEEKVIKRIEKDQKNSIIALISDAGSPLISDPGYKLVKNFIDKKIFITSIPGPTSIIPSLQISGFPINNFMFFGFVPKNKKGMLDMIKKSIEVNTTSVFYISGNKIKSFLELLSNDFINTNVAICKELTKKNESVFRGNTVELINKISKNEINLKGEFTLVTNYGSNKSKKTINESIITQISKLLKKYTLTETVEIVHKISSISKKDIYEISLKIKDD